MIQWTITPEGTLTECVTDENTVTIPNSVNSTKVRSIVEGLFFSNSTIKEVEILAKLDYIPEGCFRECESLVKVRIQNTINIGEDAFRDCTSLKEVNIERARYILPRAFKGCTSLKNVKMQGVVSVGAEAFAECTSLEGISLGEVCEQLEDECFRNCKGLKHIRICDRLRLYKDRVFMGCKELECIILRGKIREWGEDVLEQTGVKSVFYRTTGESKHREEVMDSLALGTGYTPEEIYESIVSYNNGNVKNGLEMYRGFGVGKRVDTEDFLREMEILNEYMSEKEREWITERNEVYRLERIKGETAYTEEDAERDRQDEEDRKKLLRTKQGW